MTDGEWAGALFALAQKHGLSRVSSKPPHAFLDARIVELEAALRHIVGMAGNPSAAYGCRLIINRAKEALGEK